MDILKDNNHIIRNNDYEFMITILHEVVSMNNQYSFNLLLAQRNYKVIFRKSNRPKIPLWKKILSL